MTDSKWEHLFEGMCDNAALEKNMGCRARPISPKIDAVIHLTELETWRAGVSVHKRRLADVRPPSRVPSLTIDR